MMTILLAKPKGLRRWIVTTAQTLLDQMSELVEIPQEELPAGVRAELRRRLKELCPASDALERWWRVDSRILGRSFVGLCLRERGIAKDQVANLRIDARGASHLPLLLTLIESRGVNVRAMPESTRAEDALSEFTSDTPMTRFEAFDDEFERAALTPYQMKLAGRYRIFIERLGCSSVRKLAPEHAAMNGYERVGR